MGAWTEIVDFTVPSTTSTIDIDLSSSPLSKNDFYRISLTINSVVGPGFRLFANGDYTDSNYWHQNIRADGSSVSAARVNAPQIDGGTNGVSNYNNIYLKISENNRFNYFANIIRNISSSVITSFYYGTSTFQVTSITSLRVQGIDSLGAGTRIQIYRLDAEKVADFTTTSNSTQVDIPVTGTFDPAINKDSEYLLVSDIDNSVAASIDYNLFVNDSTTLTDYRTQSIVGDGSTASASRGSFSQMCSASTGADSMSHTHIKLSEIGAFTHQSYFARNYGGNDIQIRNSFASSTSEAITSITKLNIVSSSTNAIGSGSRFILYKLK